MLTRSVAARPGGSRSLVAVFGVALAASLFLLWQGPQPCDDAHITFRHARHLATHLRPAWNLEGTPVMGSTAPAYVFGLGLLGRVLGTGAIEWLALGFNACLLFAIVVVAYLIALDLVGRAFPALLGAALVGFNGVNVYVFSLGFEAPLLILALLVGLYAARRGRLGIAMVCASLAPLVRPEGLVATPLVWGLGLLTRRLRLAHLALYLAIPAAWTVFAFAYYGSPVPQPIRAKQRFPAVYRPYRDQKVDLVTRLPKVPAGAVSTWTRRAAPVLFAGSLRAGRGLAPAQKAMRWLALLGLPLLLITVLLQPGRLIYLLYPVLFILLYAWIGRTEVWYFPSFVTLAVLILFSGVTVSLAWVEKRARLEHRRLAVAGTACAFLVFLAANNYAWNPAVGAAPGKPLLRPEDPRGRRWSRWERERFAGYRRAAERLNAEPRGAALISQVGVFGYFYEGPVIDAVGICSPEALAFYPPPEWDVRDRRGRYLAAANNCVPTKMVMTLRPRFVVNSAIYLGNLLRPGSPFARAYTPVGSVGRAWGRPILVFRRSAAAPPSFPQVGPWRAAIARSSSAAPRLAFLLDLRRQAAGGVRGKPPPDRLARETDIACRPGLFVALERLPEPPGRRARGSGGSQRREERARCGPRLGNPRSTVDEAFWPPGAAWLSREGPARGRGCSKALANRPRGGRASPGGVSTPRTSSSGRSPPRGTAPRPAHLEWPDPVPWRLVGAPKPGRHPTWPPGEPGRRGARFLTDREISATEKWPAPVLLMWADVVGAWR